MSHYNDQLLDESWETIGKLKDSVVQMWNRIRTLERRYVARGGGDHESRFLPMVRREGIGSRAVSPRR